MQVPYTQTKNRNQRLLVRFIVHERLYHMVITNNKEDTSMKTKKRTNKKIIPYSQAHRRRYPNAAGKRYYLDKAVDYALAAATSLGTVTILLFCMTFA